MQDDALFTTNAEIGWGPHFGTLVYRRELFNKGVRYPDHSEAEDYGWAQQAVKAGARLRVVPTQVDASGEPLFVCVRHGSNTWAWNDLKEGALKAESTGTRVASSALSASDRVFAASARKRRSEEEISAAFDKLVADVIEPWFYFAA